MEPFPGGDRVTLHQAHLARGQAAFLTNEKTTETSERRLHHLQKRRTTASVNRENTLATLNLTKTAFPLTFTGASLTPSPPIQPYFLKTSKTPEKWSATYWGSAFLFFFSVFPCDLFDLFLNCCFCFLLYVHFSKKIYLFQKKFFIFGQDKGNGRSRHRPTKVSKFVKLILLRSQKANQTDKAIQISIRGRSSSTSHATAAQHSACAEIQHAPSTFSTLRIKNTCYLMH